jgi:hypothetical protein
MAGSVRMKKNVPALFDLGFVRFSQKRFKKCPKISTDITEYAEG